MFSEYGTWSFPRSAIKAAHSCVLATLNLLSACKSVHRFVSAIVAFGDELSFLV